MTNTKTKPNLSTLQRSATEPDSLFELEKGTQDIVSAIMQRMKDGAEDIKIAGVDKVCPVFNQLMTGVGGSIGWSDACTVTTIEEDFYAAAAESSCSQGTD
jgi:Chromatin associated protein KTI12